MIELVFGSGVAEGEAEGAEEVFDGVFVVGFVEHADHLEACGFVEHSNQRTGFGGAPDDDALRVFGFEAVGV